MRSSLRCPSVSSATPHRVRSSFAARSLRTTVRWFVSRTPRVGIDGQIQLQLIGDFEDQIDEAMEEEAARIVDDLRELSLNRAVAMLIDQHLQRDAILVDFFSRPAATTSALAVLALRTGAAGDRRTAVAAGETDEQGEDEEAESHFEIGALSPN